MTSNQRLMLAVALSVVFFLGYTAIFPPKAQELALDENKNKNISVKENVSSTNTQVIEKELGHAISVDEKIGSANSNSIVTIKSDNFVLKLDTLGRISSKILLEDKFNNSDDLHAEVVSPTGAKPLYVRFADDVLNNEAISTAYTASVSEAIIKDKPVQVVLTQKLQDLIVTKNLIFYADGHYDVNIVLSRDARYFVYIGQRPEVSKQLMAVAGGMVYTDDEIATIIEDGDAEGRKVFSAVTLASAFDQYTASIMYGFKKDTNIIVDRDRSDNPVIYFEATPNSTFNGYLGPKEHKVLKAINPALVNAIEYGWFTFAAKPLFSLLSWLHGIFGNWGWAIIALTLIVRAILYPLTYKGMVSMQKMKELAPKMKELKEKYKSEPQRLNAATMEMYKKHGANPLGGCLPMILQIPVFFAIYRVLLNAVELQGASWMLWIDDLSRMDPTYILPILMGASMFFQQKLTPTSFTDPMQEKVMKFLPIIFTFFFLTFPSGLVLYWFVNNLFSILQQFIVNQQFANAKDVKIAIKEDAGKKDD